MFWTTAALSLVFFALFWIFYRNPSQGQTTHDRRGDLHPRRGAEAETPAGVRPGGASLPYLLAQPKVWG